MYIDKGGYLIKIKKERQKNFLYVQVFCSLVICVAYAAIHTEAYLFCYVCMLL